MFGANHTNEWNFEKKAIKLNMIILIWEAFFRTESEVMKKERTLTSVLENE